MTASGFRLKHICPFGKAIICYSRDEGRTWSAPAVTIDTPLDDRDSGIVPFGNGRVIVTSFNNTIAQQRIWNESRDMHAWPDEARKSLSQAYLDVAESLGNEREYLGSTYKISENGGYSFGKLMRSPVTAPHGPMRMNDGSLLYIGSRFFRDDKPDGGETPYLQACVMDGDDRFRVISEIENIHTPEGELLLSCEPHAVQLPGGKIIVHIRVQSLHGSSLGGGKKVFSTYQCESSDNGNTFSKPRPLLGPLGGAPAHLLLHSSGTLISVYGYREAPYGIRAMLSPDGGKTWDTDWVLTDDAASGDLGYPASVELADGRICTVFYENLGGESVIMQKIWDLPE